MDKFIDFLQDERYRNKTYDAVQQVRIADIVIKNLESEEALELLQHETRNTQKLLNNIGEHIFVFEVFHRSSKEFPNKYINRVNNNDMITGKKIQDLIPYFKTLKKKYVNVSDVEDIHNTIYKNTIEGERLDPTDIKVSEYLWFNTSIAIPILKRSFTKLIKTKDGRTFVIGSGFNIDPKEEEKKVLEEQRKRTLLTIFAIYIVIWIIIIRLLKLELIPSIISTILVLTFITIQSTNVEGPESEVELYNHLRTVSISIGAVTLALSIIYFDQATRIVKLLFISLVIVAITLIINFRELNTKTLTRLNTIILSLISIAVSCIITSAMIYISLKIKE
jgi:hypothetical protein